MSALERVQQQLADAVGKLDEAATHLDAAFTSCEESQAALGLALDGATDQEATEALGSQETATAQVDEVRSKVQAIRERIIAYLTSIGALARSGSGVGSNPPERERPAALTHPPNAIGLDGSEYPPEAAWAVPELPPRVQNQGDRTVGKVKIGDQPIPGSIRSGQRDIWADEAQQRLRRLGIRTPPFLRFHVELRAAAMLIRSGVTAAEIVINHVPCGYLSRPPGCHQVLEPFLPEGSQVTVMGTDKKGRPYRRTYTGKAKA
ncbi:DddA-like double-stranded DNA deaminase toxin [Saccharopolyspora sp. NPDC050389]|uniref:DddA-like double-stranded DNA deaminase toxin n=1 Tax=unclassified Saccharopolyspora TaxID=2646250 RepID=UPI0033E4A16B